MEPDALVNPRRRLIGRIGLLAALAGMIAIAVVLGLKTCRQGSPEFSGIGKYRFGHTTLADVDEGLCQPTDIEDGRRKATWCFGLTPYKVANRPAEIDLYFDGHEPSGALIEIQLKIRGCVEQDLDTWMRTAFGPPYATRPERGYWKNSHLWAAALMPSDPGRCLVHFLPHSEQREIARIEQK
jgi:hypothetical protein